MKTYRLINLDAASDRTLARIRNDAADPRQGYASSLLVARMSRLTGRIDQALKYEALAESAYKRLPEALRW